MHGPRLAGDRRRPRDRAVEGPVELQRRRAVAEAPERRRVAPAEGLAGEPEQGVGRHVGDHPARADPLAPGQLDADHPAALAGDPGHRRPGAHAAAERLEVADQRPAQPVRPALRARPARPVAEEVQVGGRDRAATPRGRDVTVHRRAVEPGPSARAPEELGAERLGRHQQQPHEVDHPGHAQAGEQADGTAEGREPREHRPPQRVEVRDVRLGERPPPPAIARAQRIHAPRRALEVAIQADRRPVLADRVGVARPRVHPAQPEPRERHPGVHGGGGSRRIHRGEGVVAEPGQGQRLRAHRPPGRAGRLEHEHPPAGAGEPDRRGEAVRTRPDHHRVVVHQAARSAS